MQYNIRELINIEQYDLTRTIICIIRRTQANYFKKDIVDISHIFYIFLYNSHLLSYKFCIVFQFDLYPYFLHFGFKIVAIL